MSEPEKPQGKSISTKRRMGDVLAKFARFTPDFMAAGRGDNQETQREVSPGSQGYSAEVARNI